MNARYLRYTILVSVYGSLSAPAFAYLDGATGSIILQATIGAVTAGLVYYRMFTARAKAFLARVIGKAPTGSDSE
jgi:hypothetical protein